MAKRFSKRKNTLRKSSRRKNTLRRKTMRRKNTLRKNTLRRKTLRRKNIKKRGGVPVMEDLFTSTKQLVTERAKQLVGHRKNCLNVFQVNEENYPHIVGVSFDEKNHRMRYNLRITLDWLESVPEDHWRTHQLVKRVYNANKSYSELYSDMGGIDFFGEKMKTDLENSFDFKKNKDEECKKRFTAIENAVEYYETEMNKLSQAGENLPRITGDLSSLGWREELTPQNSD